MLEFVALDIRIDKATFDQYVNDEIDFRRDSCGQFVQYEEKTAELVKSRTTAYKFSFSDDCNGVIHIIAEKASNGDIIFKPLKIKNYGESFYTMTDETPECLITCVATILKQCAIKAKGTLGVYFGDRIFIKDGKNLTNNIKSLAFIDTSNKVHFLSMEEENIDLPEDEDDTVAYVPKYMINEWLEENMQFQQKLQNVNSSDKFKLMAQFAIYQKQHDMITASQFRDIMMQIGSFSDYNDFGDENIKFIYSTII